MAEQTESLVLDIPRLQLLKTLIEKEINNALLFQEGIDLPEQVENFNYLLTRLKTLLNLSDKKIEKIVVNIGAAKEILTTVASGKLLKAIKIATNAIKPENDLKKCNPALFV